MGILKVHKRTFLLGILIVVFLAITVSAAMALTGKGGEPGAGCPYSDVYDYEFVPPPYMGTLTAFWSAGDTNNPMGLYILGSVEQLGNETCKGNIPASTPYFVMPMDLATFQGLNPNGMKACLVDIIESGYFNCIQTPSYAQIIGAGNMKSTSDTSFTVQVVIMEVKVKY